MSLAFTDPVTFIYGVGDNHRELLAKLNIETIEDLIFHIPTRYEDWSQTSPISELQPGEKVTIQVQVISIDNIFTRGGRKIQKAIVTDGHAPIQVIWFNQMYILTSLRPGMWISLSGKVGEFSKTLSIVSPKYERIAPPQADETVTTLHTGRLISIYPETAGLTSRWLRSKIKYALDHLEAIPDWRTNEIKSTISQFQNQITLSQAIHQLHFPESEQDYIQAKNRLADDELIAMHLESLRRRQSWHKNLVTPWPIIPQDVQTFIQSLPFQLTNAQQKAINQLITDFQQNQPTNRLIQGDVGSGKTVVAAAAAFLAAKCGFQTAIMAPTEILAQQHYASLTKLLSPHGLIVALQTGRTKHVKPGQDDPFNILIGTHALISDIVNFDTLGLVVIDEQHRFGVEQRAKLIAKGNSPHVISMTATPIPRTISLTLYGDLDITIIDELPPGRQPVKTWVVSETKRPSAYQWIAQHINDTHGQAFIVCPFIEPSETMETIKAAKQEFETLKSVFPQLKLDLLHGSLTGSEKDQVLKNFQQGDSQILVTTPVVEVGVDIPNASIMMIEGADRFGLAQLHQLRGRVGRSSQEAYCLLFTSNGHSQHSTRLKALENTHSGLALAELDLKLRGPGQLYGTAQHGLPELKIADFADTQRIIQTHHIAAILINLPNFNPDLLNLGKPRKIHNIAPN